MPEKQIQNWLIINWREGTTRTRKSQPKASKLGTHELATELTLDVVIPEVDVDELHATVEVPKPRVEATALSDMTAEDAPDWMDVADEQVAEFLNTHGEWSDWYDYADAYILQAIEDAPAQPPVDDVRRYMRNVIRDELRSRGEE